MVPPTLNQAMSNTFDYIKSIPNLKHDPKFPEMKCSRMVTIFDEGIPWVHEWEYFSILSLFLYDQMLMD